MAMKIGIIGGGNMAIALGSLWSAAGHQLEIGFGRDAAKLQRAADAIGGGTAVASPADVARFGEVIVLTVPWSATTSAISAIGDVAGKIIWTIVNPFKSDFSTLEIGTTTSAGEEIAKLAPGAKVVEALPLFADVLASGDVRFGGQRATVFYCGNDEHAKTRIAALLEDLDVDPVDAGPLSSGRFIEPAMLLLMRIAYAPAAGRQYALRLLHRDPVPAAR